MASKSQEPANERNRLPFEPTKNYKKRPATQLPVKSDSPTSKEDKIPTVVSQRMVRRMALFCGVPTSLGLLAFPLSYLVVREDWFSLPVGAVLITTLGLFGLGIVGLSYGVISASWEEESGSTLGWSEFKLNFGRMREAWREQRQHKKS